MTRPSILLVERHPIIAKGIENILSESAVVHTSRDNEEAWNIITQSVPDIIVSGLFRPRSTGLDFLEAIRKDPRTRLTPFVLLVGQPGAEVVNRALMQGCDEIISIYEPVTFVQIRLLRYLERAMAASQRPALAVKAEPLNVFISYAKEDSAAAQDIWRFLLKNGVDAWIDEKKLMSGQEWDAEIRRAMRVSHLIIICLSNTSVSKRGYVQREFRLALDLANEQPLESMFVLPLRLEPCAVPEQLSKWQWLDYFARTAKSKLITALTARANALSVLPPKAALFPKKRRQS